MIFCETVLCLKLFLVFLPAIWFSVPFFARLKKAKKDSWLIDSFFTISFASWIRVVPLQFSLLSTESLILKSFIFRLYVEEGRWFRDGETWGSGGTSPDGSKTCLVKISWITLSFELLSMLATKVQLVWEGRKIWINLQQFLEIALQRHNKVGDFLEFSEYLNFMDVSILKVFMEIVRTVTGTISTSISSMYVCSSHFPRVHLGENHANEFWYTMGSKSFKSHEWKRCNYV